MLRTVLITLGLLGMTACGGGGGKSALVDACIEQGDSREACTCMADKMEEGLSPEAFEAMVLGAQGKDDEAQALMENIGIGEGMKIAALMVTVVAECKISVFGK